MYYTDEEGRIVLSDPELSLRDGWFRIEELEPPKGFSLTESSKQEAFIAAGEGHTFRIYNRPNSAIVVWKYDSVHPEQAIEGAVFQVRYLSGNTSGTGGTVIGTYRTSPNGSFTVTDCKPGTYIIEELSSDGSHVIDTPPQTVYLSGEEQEVIQVHFGNSPMGSLLIKKVSSTDNAPISGVQFFVTESDGTVIGDSNGYFTTDSTGTILIEGIEPGTALVVKETRAKEGFLLDDTPQTAQIKAGQTVTLEFRNQPQGNLIIHKLSSADKSPLEGVQFKITYADGSYLPDKNGQLSSNGLYWTNSEGQIVLSNVTGTLVITEVQSIPGYTIDPNTQSQTVVVRADDNTGDNGENKSVFHFGSADQTAQDTRSYRMWPGNFPTFTFQVEFSGDNTQLDQVYVVTESKSGHRTYVETTYDAGSGRWLGTQQYYAFEDAPQGIGVIYSFKGSDDLDVQEEMFQDNMFSFVTSDTQPLADLIGIEIGGEKSGNAPLTFEVQEASEQENDLQGVLKITEKNDPLFWYRLQQTQESRTAQQLAANGFYPINETKTLYTLASYRENAIQMQYADLTNHVLLTETYYFEDPQATAVTARAPFILLADTREIPTEVMDSIFDAYGKITDKLTLAGITKDLIELTDAQIQWRMQIQGNVDVLLIDANALGKVLDAKCPDGSDRLDADTQMQMTSELIDIGQDIQIYQDTATNRTTGAAVSKLMSVIGNQLFEKAFDKIPFASKMAKYNVLEQITEIGKQYFTPEIENALVNGIKLPNGTTIPIDQLPPALYSPASVESYINSTAAGLKKRLDALNTSFKNTKCEDKEPEEDDQTGKSDSSENYTDWGYSVNSVESEIKETIPILDPSGYVYEAVPSNRLTDVTATAYYQGENSNEILWDAENYDQINPQITGPDGAYAWFVPEGQWKVKFTKYGYRSADSGGVPAAAGNTGNTGWLPVPPPQFGVNVGMVSTAAPTVENTIAYTDRIEVTFSQYMNIGSVADAISLNQDGQPISVKVTALDAEYALDGSTQYATRFAVTPVDGDCAGTLTIAADAENYADTRLENTYTAALAAPIQRPTAITAGDCPLVVHEAGTLMVTLVNGAAGTTLAVENLTPSLLSLSDQSVVTDADGTAALTLTGNLPGVGQIRVTEPVSGLSEAFYVSISMTEKDVPGEVKPEPVIAVLSDGTVVTTGMTVEKETKITLSTTTEGATIRYTLNDTCPCKDEALTYTGPIAITADTTLRAAAVLDGVYSDTIRLELMIKAEQSGGGTGGGGSSSVSHAVETADTEHGTITVTPSRAKNGDTVTITVKPDAGYVLRTLTVADGKGNDVKLIDMDSRTYRFTMPDSVVLVNAVFAQELETVITFTDVDAEDYFYDAVAWAVAHNVTFGTSDTTFSPDNVCTRAQAVTFLWRAAGSPQPQMIINPFKDVQESDYFYNAVLWAVENNITAGTSAGTFSPDTVCTRSQAVTFLYRYDGTVATEMTEFIDVNETAYYYDAVQWAAQNGITSGTGTNTFSPEANCMRAQIVTFLYRALKK